MSLVRESNLNQPILLNPGDDNEMEIFGYKTHICRRALFILGAILTCGILAFLFYKKPKWNVWANCVPCTLEEADTVLLRTTDDFKTYTRKKVGWIYLSKHTDDSLVRCEVISDKASALHRAIIQPDMKVRYIQVQKIQYAWDPNQKKFFKAGALENSYSCCSIHSTFGSGLTKDEENIRQLICGPNGISIQIIPIWKLILKEISYPFYLFQLFSVCLWFAEGYTNYAIGITVIMFLSIAMAVYNVRKQSVKLHKLVESHNRVTVKVCRSGGEFEKISSTHLVPGDVFIIEGNREYLSCDAILINGTCVNNESMLTGESVPVTKMPLPNTDDSMPWMAYSKEDYRRHVLFCGTQVIQTRPSGHCPVKAVVMRTGFNTAKGEMIRSILYPKPASFKLLRDAYRFLMCLVAVGITGVIYAACIVASNGSGVGQAILKSLDVLTIAIPPSLPAALTVGILYAQRRLKKQGIFCISPERINICGQLNLICFDKTGTLTEDGLDVCGLVTADGKRLTRMAVLNFGTILPWGPLFAALASCHSLILVDDKIQGDPLDMKMFEATGWELMEKSYTKTYRAEGTTQNIIVKPRPGSSQVFGHALEILHQFPFSSSLQRMSVITRQIGGDELIAYMKGAPEKVVSLCRPETVPTNFSSDLQFYTQKGFRVIAFGYNSIGNFTGKLTDLQRETVESDLTFLGLLILENRLKPETVPALRELKDARIRTVMITGDNLLTAVTVARNSGMIHEASKVVLVEAEGLHENIPASISWTLLEKNTQNGCLNHNDIYLEMESTSLELKRGEYHFAMTGKSYEVILHHFYTLLPKLLMNAMIFARMSPGQKASLVEEFQKLEYCVGMCGDGANDAGALKMAHAGISLSDQEASVASPFTSKIPSIRCVPLLIKEGRAALVTSFCMFKYMALYSIIQYFSVLLLYWQMNNFSDYQYQFEDILISIFIGLTMNLNHAYPKLVPYRPPGQLISPPLLLSVIVNLMLSLAMQVAGFILVQYQPWYSSNDMNSGCQILNNSFGMEIPNNYSLNMTMADNVTNMNENEDEERYASYERTTVWLLSVMNCIIVAFVFSKGKPFRKPIYTNWQFTVVLLAQLGACLFILFADLEGLYNVLEIVCMPTLWRVYILIMLIINLVASFIVEEIIVENRRLWLFLKQIFKRQSKSRYNVLKRVVSQDPSWPPINQTEQACQIGIQTDNKPNAYCNSAYENNESQLSSAQSIMSNKKDCLSMQGTAL
ncbi:probable cation-transporting ATPase 13A4 [Protopterus annectens]|uniref:probable cation-transporting ATPase 13A4 n=1 Tax=Protopterus annectens TaxID=7888 RepID=UPI001CFA0BB1|nr:probable cation-transporting ATPase 13A4 [Protopterus annectens]